MSQDKQELLEIYKLHAELADRVSQRREGANRLYASLLTGFFILSATLVRFGYEAAQFRVVLCCVGILGLMLSVSWIIIVRSYRQLNSGKFHELHKLEDKLAYPFFKREWESLGKGEDKGRYFKLTTVETFLPATFIILFLFLIGFSLFQR